MNLTLWCLKKNWLNVDRRRRKETRERLLRSKKRRKHTRDLVQERLMQWESSRGHYKQPWWTPSKKGRAMLLVLFNRPRVPLKKRSRRRASWLNWRASIVHPKRVLLKPIVKCRTISATWLMARKTTLRLRRSKRKVWMTRTEVYLRTTRLEFSLKATWPIIQTMRSPTFTRRKT